MSATGLASLSVPVRQLAQRWLELVAADPAVDFAVSPTGLWLALAAVASGARGATAEELRAVLDVAGPGAAEACRGVVRALAGTEALAVATGVWSRVPIHPQFRAALPDVGFGEVDPAAIDAWVCEATGGLIERLPVAVSPADRLVLVNALALKARWARPFKAGQTEDRPFTDAAGAVCAVPTMTETFAARAGWAVPEAGGGSARVVELECAAQGDAAARVRFVLGPPGRRAADVLPAAWAPEAVREPLDADRVRVFLPRLAIRTTLDVTGNLAALGVGLAGTAAADFSGVSPEPLRIDRVVQEAVVRVAEEGVEAAAATAVMMRSLALVRGAAERVAEIAFDRPFGVVVLDASGGIPLFTAWQASAPRYSASG
jgi:serine protease inhibitor